MLSTKQYFSQFLVEIQLFEVVLCHNCHKVLRHLRTDWDYDCKFDIKYANNKDFPGSPVVKASPSNVGSVCLTPGQEANTSHASQAKNQSIKWKHIVTNSVKTKNGPHEENLKKKNANND